MRIHRTYYEVLGLKTDATPAQIKASYHDLVRKYHPDRNKQSRVSERIFMQLNMAYRTLSRSEQRAMYDASLAKLHASKRPESPAAASQSNGEAASVVVDKAACERVLAEASTAYVGGDMAKAAELCRKALGHHGGNVNALSLLGDVHLQQRKPVDAHASFQAALDGGGDSRILRFKLDRAATMMRVAQDSADSAAKSAASKQGAATDKGHMKQKDGPLPKAGSTAKPKVGLLSVFKK